MSAALHAPHNEQVSLNVEDFLRDGYVAIRDAFSPETASACRQATWDAMNGQGVRADDPATWPPLVKISHLAGEPFATAGSAPRADGCL
jgi:hypothetical protein